MLIGKLKTLYYKVVCVKRNILNIKYYNRNTQIKEKGVVLVSHDAQKLGASLLLLHLASEYVRSGINVVIISLNFGPLNDDYARVAPLQIALTKYKLKKTLRLLHNKYNYDKLIANTVVSGSCVPIAKKEGYEVVTLVHELGAVIKKLNAEHNSKLIMKNSDHVVFSTSIAQKEMKDIVHISNKNEYIKQQGVYFDKPSKEDIKFEVENIFNKYPMLKNKKIVLGIGNTTYRKGFDIFLSTADKLSDYIFIWAGKKENHYDKIINERNNFLPKNFMYVGQLSSKNLAGFYSIADLMLMSSRKDTLPSTIFESLMFNVPVIGSKDSGGIVDVINDENGLLTKNCDSYQFASAIEKMINYKCEKKCHFSYFSFSDYASWIINLFK